MRKQIMALFLLLCFGSISMAMEMTDNDRKEAVKILEHMRKRIAKEDEEAAKRAAEEAEARRAAEEQMVKEGKMEASDMTTESMEAGNHAEKLAQTERMSREDARREAKKKLTTPMERLDFTHQEALEKLDFYERVVRSVQREEAEIKAYKDIVDMDI